MIKKVMINIFICIAKVPCIIALSEFIIKPIQNLTKCLFFIFIYMFSIKITFKGKNFLLGKGITSFDQILNEVLNRFPGECPYGAQYKYLDQQLPTFSKIESIVTENNMKTIKIEVVPLQQRRKEEVQVKEQEKQIELEDKEQKEQKKESIEEKECEKEEEEKKQEDKVQIVIEEEKQIEQVQIVIEEEKPEIEKQIQIEEPKEEYVPEIKESQIKKTESVEMTISENLKEQKLQEKQEAEQVKIIQLQKPKQVQKQAEEERPMEEEEKEEKKEAQEQEDVYKCFYCDGKGLLCRVCASEGRFTQNSRFIKLIDRIIDKRLEIKLKQLEKKSSEEKEDKLMMMEEEEKPIVPKQVDYPDIEINVEHLKINPPSFKIEEEIEWKFLINVKGELDGLPQTNIIDEKTGLTVPFKMNNGLQHLKMGPFKAEKVGKLDKTFRFFFFNYKSEMQFFGPKFGFSVNVEKGEERIQLNNKFRAFIDKKKKEYKLNKETEYIVERLKEIGINEDNIHESEAFLGDIFESI